jgi:hypothetical protein
VLLVLASLVILVDRYYWPVPSLTSHQKVIVNALTSNLKTRCVGRYLIDMPADSRIFGWLTIQDVKIGAKAMTLDEFNKAMQARSIELKNTKSYFGYRFLRDDNVIQGIPQSRYFISLGNTYTDPDSHQFIEAYRWDNGYQIKMTIEAYDALHSTYYKDDPSSRNDPDMNDLPEKFQRVVSLMRHAHGRTDDEIPKSPGTCFQGGWIDGGQYDHENPSAQFVMPGHDDVDFSLETDTNIHIYGYDTLSDVEGDLAIFLQGHPSTALRRGKVDLPGMIDPHEELRQGITGDNIPGYMFELEANALDNPGNRPVTKLIFCVGQSNAGTIDPTNGKNTGTQPPEKASLTESEAVAVWDAISRTLRPRPNAF